MRTLTIASLVGLTMIAAGFSGCRGDDASDGPDRSALGPAAPGEPPTVAPRITRDVPLKGAKPVVIASGLGPDDEPFEVIAFGTSQGPCVIRMHPGRSPRQRGGFCGKAAIPSLNEDELVRATDASSYPDGRDMLEGWVSTEVDSVSITYLDAEGETVEIPATLEPVPDWLQRQGRERPPAGYFVAFSPPGDTEASQLKAAAFDQEGDQIGQDDWLHLDTRFGGMAGFAELPIAVPPRLEPGRRVAGQTGCLACHKFGEGGNPGPGPDLTRIGSRLSQRQIAEALVKGPGVMPSYAVLRDDQRERFRDLLAFLAWLN